MSDTAALSTALAEAAIAEVQHNPQFIADIRRRYDEVISQRGGRAKRAPRGEPQPLPPLVPVRRDTTYREVDPFKPPDPEFLIYVYGRAQLARALQEYTLDMLKQTADRIQQRHPGTRPASRAHKDAVIAYIVEHS